MLRMLDGILNWSCDSHGERSPSWKTDKVCSEEVGFRCQSSKEEGLRQVEWVCTSTTPSLSWRPQEETDMKYELQGQRAIKTKHRAA